MANVADYGLNMRESFASYDPATSLWRTSQLCFTGEWAEYLETWPRAGTMRNGVALELATLDCHICDSAFGFLPTPTASDWKRSPLKQSYCQKPLVIGEMDTLSQWAGRRYFAVHPQETRWWPNPSLWEVVQGYPVGWTDLRDSATPSSRKSQNGLEDES